MTLSRCPTPATQFARCHHLMQPWQCNSQKTRNMTHLESKVLRLPRRMNMDTSKFCMPRKMKVIFWKPCESIAPVTKNDFSTPFADTSECQDAPCLPRKTTLNLLGHLRKREVQQPPHTNIILRGRRNFSDTLHFTFHTLHRHTTLYNLHSTLYIPHSTLRTLHFLHSTLHIFDLHSTLYTL